MLQNIEIKSFTAEVSLKNTNTISDSFKIHLTSNQGRWNPVILIISKGDLNPLDFFSQTIRETKSLLGSFGIEINACTIYIDLMECLGIYNPYIFRWIISQKGDYFENQLEEIEFDDVTLEDRNVLDSYFKDRWSVLTSSCLTTEEKIELIANAFSSSIYDTSTADYVQSSFKEKLNEVIEHGSALIWKFNQ